MLNMDLGMLLTSEEWMKGPDLEKIIGYLHSRIITYILTSKTVAHSRAAGVRHDKDTGNGLSDPVSLMRPCSDVCR